MIKLSYLSDMLKNLMLFKEPVSKEPFILKETASEHEEKDKNENNSKGKKDTKKENSILKDLFMNKEKDNDVAKNHISKKLSENLEYIKEIYSVPASSDIVVREFEIVSKNKLLPAFIVFIDGMADRKVIDDNMLQPLMIFSNLDMKDDNGEVLEYVKNHLLPHNQLKIEKTHDKVIEEINFGGCGLYIDGINSAFVADVKGWEHRGIERPNTELVIRGPQEGFNESLRSNTALIRKRLKDENLVVESIQIGQRSKTPCAILYIKDIANESLVNEVKRRLNGVKVDYIFDSGELEQFIEDDTFMPAPQILATERPDRVTELIAQGKVTIIMDGSPFALVIPTTNYELMHTSEDIRLRFPYANLIRFIRLTAVGVALLLPGLYVAITNYHQEMIPTDLLLAISTTREMVPFPSVIEILLMEISFELIREAGIRIPGPIGPTLGIIGALILGQAAVAANIVSPILIIVVAVTGIGSFAIPNFSLSFSFRLLRFVYIIFAALSGFLGITTGLFIHGLWLVNAKSFGVPFLAPLAPKTSGSFFDEITREPIWKQEKRPDYLNTAKVYKQEKISREWDNEKNKN